MYFSSKEKKPGNDSKGVVLKAKRRKQTIVNEKNLLKEDLLLLSKSVEEKRSCTATSSKNQHTIPESFQQKDITIVDTNSETEKDLTSQKQHMYSKENGNKSLKSTDDTIKRQDPTMTQKADVETFVPKVSPLKFSASEGDDISIKDNEKYIIDAEGNMISRNIRNKQKKMKKHKQSKNVFPSLHKNTGVSRGLLDTVDSCNESVTTNKTNEMTEEKRTECPGQTAENIGASHNRGRNKKTKKHKESNDDIPSQQENVEFSTSMFDIVELSNESVNTNKTKKRKKDKHTEHVGQTEKDIDTSQKESKHKKKKKQKHSKKDISSVQENAEFEVVQPCHENVTPNKSKRRKKSKHTDSLEETGEDRYVNTEKGYIEAKTRDTTRKPKKSKNHKVNKTPPVIQTTVVTGSEGSNDNTGDNPKQSNQQTEKNVLSGKRYFGHSIASVGHTLLNENIEPQQDKEKSRKHKEKKRKKHKLDKKESFLDKPIDKPIENTEGTEDCSNPMEKMAFTLNAQDWSNIKPLDKRYSGKTQRLVRRLGGNWTNVFSKLIQKTHPSCVLSFRSHCVKTRNSRKVSGPFLTAKARCQGQGCCCIFEFSIQEEPKENQDVIVHLKTDGFVFHDPNEINRRDVTGEERTAMGRKIQATSVAATYLDNLLKADTAQLAEGNYTQVPTQAVLRKLVSQCVQKEYLHQNILSELEVLKEGYADDTFIQDIGMDPFSLVLFSDKQLKLIRQLSKENRLDLYVDATGSVITNITGQKRPYLYSVVVKPSPECPPVSIADMISTQHTIPRIDFFLASLKRAVALGGTPMVIRKFETDYSFALIQSCLKMSNTMTLKRYIARCFDICTGEKKNLTFTCLHLCAAHMIRDFIRNIKPIEADKKKKHFLMSVFIILQNTTSLSVALELYENITILFLSEYETPEATRALLNLQENIKRNRNCQILDLDEETLCDDVFVVNAMDEEDMDELTIKEASPFTTAFHQTRCNVMEKMKITSSTLKNSMYCPRFVELLADKYLPIYPLWSGVILSRLENASGSMTSSDTNNPVENWFKYLKCDLKLTRLRPAKFVTKLKQAIDGGLKEYLYPGGRKNVQPRESKFQQRLFCKQKKKYGKRNERKRHIKPYQASCAGEAPQKVYICLTRAPLIMGSQFFICITYSMPILENI